MILPIPIPILTYEVLPLLSPILSDENIATTDTILFVKSIGNTFSNTFPYLVILLLIDNILLIIFSNNFI